MSTPTVTGQHFEWREATGRVWRSKCKSPLETLDDCKYTKYLAQQWLYRLILERHTPLRLSAMYLLVCHPNQTPYYDFMPLPADGDRLIEKWERHRLAVGFTDPVPEGLE